MYGAHVLIYIATCSNSLWYISHHFMYQVRIFTISWHILSFLSKIEYHIKESYVRASSSIAVSWYI